MRRNFCIASARYSLICDIIKPAGSPEATGTNDTTWEYYQDPDSGAIVKRGPDDPETPEFIEGAGTIIQDVPLAARGIIDGGIRVAGTTERFSDTYEGVDWVKATFGPKTSITRRDRITNIRQKKTGDLVWKEEEISGHPATTFNVMGVTPVLDPFSSVVEYSVLLERAEVQGA